MSQVVATVGLHRVAELIKADLGHSAVGDGIANPVVGDETLVNETHREATSKAIRTGRSIQHRTFYANADLPVTVKEVGWFLNGTATAGSGELLVRALLEFTAGDDDLTLVLQLKVKNPDEA